MERKDTSGEHKMIALMEDLAAIAERQHFRVERLGNTWTFSRNGIHTSAGHPQTPADLWSIIARLQVIGLKISDHEG
jgi:hypothetical protein